MQYPRPFTLGLIESEVIKRYKLLGGTKQMNLNGGEVLIFSVYQPTESRETNYANHVVSLSRLRDLYPQAMEVDGCYNGEEEKSILLPTEAGNRLTALGVVKHLCRDFGQDTYMLVDTAGMAALYSPEIGGENGGHVRELGKLTAVDSVEGLTAWTRIGKIYYVAGGK